MLVEVPIEMLLITLLKILFPVPDEMAMALTVGDPEIIPVKFKAEKVLFEILLAPAPPQFMPIIKEGDVALEVNEKEFPENVIILLDVEVEIPVMLAVGVFIVIEFPLMFPVLV